jgi:hypothetical protein
MSKYSGSEFWKSLSVRKPIPLSSFLKASYTEDIILIFFWMALNILILFYLSESPTTLAAPEYG